MAAPICSQGAFGNAALIAAAASIALLPLCFADAATVAGEAVAERPAGAATAVAPWVVVVVVVVVGARVTVDAGRSCAAAGAALNPAATMAAARWLFAAAMIREWRGVGNGIEVSGCLACGPTRAGGGACGGLVT